MKLYVTAVLKALILSYIISAAALIALLKDEETAKSIKDEVMYTER